MKTELDGMLCIDLCRISTKWHIEWKTYRNKKKRTEKAEKGRNIERSKQTNNPRMWNDNDDVKIMSLYIGGADNRQAEQKQTNKK